MEKEHMNTKMNAEKEWLRKLKVRKTAEKNELKAPAVSIEQVDCKPQKQEKHNGFSDVAGMDDLKKLITEVFINVLNNPKCAKAYGVTPPSILFYGPAGCGKSFFVEKISDVLGIPVIKVVPDDLASTLVHGTQEKIGKLFGNAADHAPVILFFDEFDAMVPKRSNDDHNYQNGEVNEFLCMMNNAAKKGIYVLAATNHPEMIDKAVLRSGRIDEIIYIDMPDMATRESLFRLALKKLPAAEDIDYNKLADMTEGYNCSDISLIVNKASLKMFNASIQEKDKPYKLITQELLEETIKNKAPSVSSRELKEFERVRSEFSPLDKECKHQTIGFR